MSATKVILSGNIVEVYEYEKIPIRDQSNKGGRHNEGKEDRKEEYSKTVNYRAREQVRRLILSNFNDGDKFITLTFAENVTDIEKANKEFKKFIQRITYKSNKAGLIFKYIAVIEFQKRGAVHYHMISNVDDYLLGEGDIKAKERYFAAKYWKNGFVDIKDIKGVDNVGAYVVKYMQKEFQDNIDKLAGKKRYFFSRNLDKPVEVNGEFLDPILEQMESYYPVFTSSFDTDFHGIVKYKEYNLLRGSKEE